VKWGLVVELGSSFWVPEHTAGEGMPIHTVALCGQFDVHHIVCGNSPGKGSVL
jgi:hypothetical protein